MPKSVVAGGLIYLSRISRAKDFTDASRIFFAEASSRRRRRRRAHGYRRRPGTSRRSAVHRLPSFPGSLIAYSTGFAEPFFVTIFVSYCSGAKAPRIAPSWISPKIPRVLTFDSTFFRSPTPDASCHLAQPLIDLLQPFAHNRKALVQTLVESFCSFSSTVSRAFGRAASCYPPSKALMLRSTPARMSASACAFCREKEAKRSSNCAMPLKATGAIARSDAKNCSVSSQRRLSCADCVRSGGGDKRIAQRFDVRLRQPDRLVAAAAHLLRYLVAEPCKVRLRRRVLPARGNERLFQPKQDKERRRRNAQCQNRNDKRYFIHIYHPHQYTL